MELRQYQQAIENEPLSDEEVRLLLGRIGELQFGGPDIPTVSAVAEATGQDSVAVARLLESIRRETFEDRYGRRLDEIEALARDTAVRVQAPLRPPPVQVIPNRTAELPSPFGRLDEPDGWEESARRESSTAMESVTRVIGIMLLMILGFVFLVALGAPRRDPREQPHCAEQGPNGTWHDVPCDILFPSR